MNVRRTLRKALSALGVEVTLTRPVHHTGGQTLCFPAQDFERFGSYGSYGIDYVHGRGRAVPTVAIDDIDLSFQEYVDFVLGSGYYFAKVISGQNFLVLPR